MRIVLLALSVMEQTIPGAAEPLSIRAWILCIIVGLLGILFLICWWTFNYPLTNCDSPSWAPSYLKFLKYGEEHPPVNPLRGWLVPTFFHALGLVTISLGVPNFIGAAQAVIALVALVTLSLLFVRRLSLFEVVLVPAFFFSFLRFAIHTQIIYSETFAMIFFVLLIVSLLAENFGWKEALAAGISQAFLFHIRVDSIYLLPILVARALSSDGGSGKRLRSMLLTLIGFSLTHFALRYPLGPDWKTEPPLAKLMIVAEWMRHTKEPTNSLATRLYFPLVERLRAEAGQGSVEGINVAMDEALKVYREHSEEFGWENLARYLAYQFVNSPAEVVSDRARALADLYTFVYSSFWKDYQPFGGYAWAYQNWIFGKWTLEEINTFVNNDTCPEPAHAQAEYFERPPIRSERAFNLLLRMHEMGTPYMKYVLRPLFLAMIPLCIWFLITWHHDYRFNWLTAIIVAHLGLRAALVVADERYQLPIDLLMVWWCALGLREVYVRITD